MHVVYNFKLQLYFHQRCFITIQKYIIWLWFYHHRGLDLNYHSKV